MQSPNQGIANWLRELGLEEYAPAFARNRIDAELLPELSDSELQRYLDQAQQRYREPKGPPPF